MTTRFATAGAAVAVALAAMAGAAGQAQAFHPFDQPTGYQMPKWIEKRQPRPQVQAVKPPKQKPAQQQAAAMWDDEDDEPAPQQKTKPVATKYPPLLEGGPRPAISAAAPPVVKAPAGFAPGSIVIDTAGKSLYYVLSSGSAYKYPISVGRIGFTWTGTQKISRVASWPDWRPPTEMKQRVPGLPDVMTGGIRNPLGARALYLGNTLYRIHGTNDAKTIGQAASSGCFRMHNTHVVHLAGLASVGTTVRVMSRLPSNVASNQSKAKNS